MSLKRGGQRRKHKIQQTRDAGKSAFRQSVFGPSWTDADNISETRRKEREHSVLTLVTVCGFCRSKRLFIIHHDVFSLQVPACRLLCYLPLCRLTPPRLNPRNLHPFSKNEKKDTGNNEQNKHSGSQICSLLFIGVHLAADSRLGGSIGALRQG